MALSDDLAQLKASFASPDAALVDLLVRRISQWRADDTSVDALCIDLSQILSGLTFSSHERHAQVALALARLRDAVDTVGGMTMNERLVVFGLVDDWDHGSEAHRATLRAKVLG